MGLGFGVFIGICFILLFMTKDTTFKLPGALVDLVDAYWEKHKGLMAIEGRNSRTGVIVHILLKEIRREGLMPE